MDVLLIIAAIVIGLIFGSFFNVVISRYPVMLYQNWQEECNEFLKIETRTQKEKFNLVTPRSRCPQCHIQLKAWQNIPLISYIFLRGRCANCQKPISLIYPTVEALTAILTLLVFWKFGLSYKTIPAIIFTWGLIVLSFIDIKEQILPDTITLPLLWLGLILNGFHIFASAQSAILGAAIAYSLLWIIAKSFKILRHKDGMGHGDFKLFACLCAWLGVGALLNILMVSVITSLLISIILLALRKMTKEQPIPFGPFLALGGWATFMFGPFVINWINQLYL